MKRLFFVVTLLLIAFQSFAGEKIDFSMLKNEVKVNVEYIWNDLSIDGKEVKDWLEYRQAEQPEWDAQKEFSEELKPQIGEMIATANKKLEDKNLYFVKNKSCKYTLKLIPQNIKKKGDNFIKCQLVETDGQKIINEFTIKGDGGVFGSMGNLWGDGFKDAGKKLAKIIKKTLK